MSRLGDMWWLGALEREVRLLGTALNPSRRRREVFAMPIVDRRPNRKYL